MALAQRHADAREKSGHDAAVRHSEDGAQSMLPVLGLR